MAMRRINNFLYGFMVLMIASTLFYKPLNSTLAYSTSLIIYPLLRFVNRKYNWNLEEYHHTLIMIALYLNLMGFQFNFYGRLRMIHYDKILHLIIPFMLSLPANRMITKPSSRKLFMTIIVIFTVTGGSAVFELIEYILDLLGNYGFQGVFSTSGDSVMNALDDTMLDIGLGFVGSSVMNVILYRKYKKSIKTQVSSSDISLQ